MPLVRVQSKPAHTPPPTPAQAAPELAGKDTAVVLPKAVVTKTGITVSLFRRPTVDRAWVVEALCDGLMIDLAVVEGKEDRKQVLEAMVKKHGGRA